MGGPGARPPPHRQSPCRPPPHAPADVTARGRHDSLWRVRSPIRHSRTRPEPSVASPPSGARALLPGLLLAGALTLAAWALQTAEVALLGHAVVEALVLAILLGMIVRTA